MPFLYDVWNVKLQLYAKGLVWSWEGKHFSKTFSIFYMLNSKNWVFNPYFSIGTCLMRKWLLWISRGLNLLSFSLKKYHFLWNFSLVIFMGNPSLRLSEVLRSLTYWFVCAPYPLLFVDSIFKCTPEFFSMIANSMGPDQSAPVWSEPILLAI